MRTREVCRRTACVLLVLQAAVLLLSSGGARAFCSGYHVSMAAPSDPPPKVTLTETTYRGRPAYRLSDGKTEALIVPSLSGRVLRYGFVGGPNRLWEAPRDKTFGPSDWANWGGDKTWLAPQSAWPLYSPQGGWPPHPTFDGEPHNAIVLPAASAADASPRLLTTGPVMVGVGVRVTRTFSIDPVSGEFLVEATFRKQMGDEPKQASVWNVTQVPPPDAVFVSLNSQSAYKNHFHWFGAVPPAAHRASTVSPTLLQVQPTEGFYKLGVDTPVPAAAAVKDGVALVLRAARREGEYPEGAAGSGFPFTLWNQGEKSLETSYMELEMMSPLAVLRRGDTLTHTVRWSLHRLPARNIQSPAVRSAVARLLKTPSEDASAAR